MTIIRWVIFLLPTLLVTLGAYLLALHQAELFAPPMGSSFPREPVLKGVYRFEVLKGRTNYRSAVGETIIHCNTFSYYDGTFLQTAGRFDCNYLMEKLQDKQVEVYRIWVPRINIKVESTVVKIVSDGRAYLDRSDAQVRELWIRDTNQDIFAFMESVFLLSLLVFWPVSGVIMKKWIGKKKTLT
ncbi:hypothetical protein [Desulfobulbus sp.]|uniref:hypothetical protein n=1 Tax=Desulfobulbus sp. TaxID=895 RepID=UPI0027BB008E|nr:hypothetical protein [Desulfobulbus sp.]